MRERRCFELAVVGSFLAGSVSVERNWQTVSAQVQRRASTFARGQHRGASCSKQPLAAINISKGDTLGPRSAQTTAGTKLKLFQWRGSQQRRRRRQSIESGHFQFNQLRRGAPEADTGRARASRRHQWDLGSSPALGPRMHLVFRSPGRSVAGNKQAESEVKPQPFARSRQLAEGNWAHIGAVDSRTAPLKSEGL